MSAAQSATMLLSPHSLVDPPRPGGDPQRRAGKHAASPPAVREIVACLDGSDLGSGIVPHAEVVAQALGARLTLLRVLETEAGGGAPPDPLDWGIRRREARAQLDGMADRLGTLASGVGVELIQGHAAEQICGWAEQHEVDLTVLCSHGSRGVTDWDLASTARKLIERTPGSLLLVPAGAAKAGPVRYRRILVPLDGSARGESVVPLAMRIAASQEAELLLVHVIPEPEITRAGPLDAEGAELRDRVLEHNHRVANDYLDRLRARVGHAGCRVRARVVGNGSVRTRLEELIQEERADLVVMSAHGHTGRIEGPCGTVTEHAMTHAIVPVLVVRERLRRRMRRVDPPTPRPVERFGPAGFATL